MTGKTDKIYEINKEYLIGRNKKINLDLFGEFMNKKGLDLSVDLVNDELYNEYLVYIRKLLIIKKEVLRAKKRVNDLDNMGSESLVSVNERVDIARKNGLNVPSYK